MNAEVPREGLKHRSWPLPDSWGLADSARSNNLPLWRQLFEAEAQRLQLQAHSLGTALGEPLMMFTRPAAKPDVPHRLLACGFHGEEPAGPWGLLRLLQKLQGAELEGLHLTLLPLVNVTGFAAGTRFNAEGDNPNRGFAPGDFEASAEGHLLLQHASILAAASRHGVMSCHEDVLTEGAYLYAFERRASPGPHVYALLQANLHHFPAYPDGSVDGCTIQGGIVFNHHDGSFEDWVFGLGAEFAVCVETPGLQDFGTRVFAQAQMMRTFLAL